MTEENKISIFIDPDTLSLKSDLKTLEKEFNELSNEKIEVEKLLNDFQHRHTVELGNVILEILKLQKLKFKDDKQKFDEAEEDYKQYSEQFEKEKQKHQFDLTDEEKIELKKKFRKATFLCHPDKVNEEFKDTAQKIFIELKAAYEANDLITVTEILNDLEKGNYFMSQSDTVSEKKKLLTAIAKLKIQIKTLEIEIKTIKESETFKTIIRITDWDKYFIMTKEKLKQEVEKLQNKNYNPQ